MKDIRIGFIDMRGLCSTFHQVLAMDENFNTSSSDTEFLWVKLLLDGGSGGGVEDVDRLEINVLATVKDGTMPCSLPR